MGSRRKTIRLKKSNHESLIKKTIEIEGKKYTLSFSSEFDLLISALGLSLLALKDPKVNAVLKQFGLQFFDEDGKPIEL